MLFQVHFLALLLEERGSGDLAAVAEHCARKLVRRHPHVFGDVEAEDAATVLRNWDAIKRGERGGAGADEVPRSLPATIYARKVQRRAAARGQPQLDLDAALARVVEEARALAEAGTGASPGGTTSQRLREERFGPIGELLYAAVAAARALGVDAELALRAAADRREHADEPAVSAPEDGPR